MKCKIMINTPTDSDERCDENSDEFDDNCFYRVCSSRVFYLMVLFLLATLLVFVVVGGLVYNTRYVG